MKQGDRFQYHTADEGLICCEVTLCDAEGTVYFCSDQGIAGYLSPVELIENRNYILMGVA